MSARRFLTVDEAVETLRQTLPHVSQRYVRRVIADGRLPHYKIASRIWIDPQDLQALIESGRRDCRGGERTPAPPGRTSVAGNLARHTTPNVAS